MTLRPTRSTLPDTRLPYTTRFRAASARHSARRLRGARAPTCIRGGKARPRRACAIAMIEHILAWLAGIIISVISATGYQIGRAHVCTPVTNAHLVCRLLLEKKQTAL